MLLPNYLLLNDFKALSYQMGFIEPASSSLLGIIDLHHSIMFYLIVVLVLVFWLLFRVIVNELGYPHFIKATLPLNLRRHSSFQNCALLEIIWTVIPSLIIFSIAIPSLSLLHSIDEFIEPAVTLKVIGNQWYWSYEYSDYTYANTKNSSICFDSNLKLDGSVKNLLEVDNEVVLPTQTVIRFLITSEDVLHSWAIPSLGIKMDAVPGRLNQVITSAYKTGIFYGQCSELCGVGHGYMPIKIKMISFLNYLDWISDYYLNNDSLTIPYSSNGLLEFIYFLNKKENKTNSDSYKKSLLIHTNKSLTCFLVSLKARFSCIDLKDLINLLN